MSYRLADFKILDAEFLAKPSKIISENKTKQTNREHFVQWKRKKHKHKHALFIFAFMNPFDWEKSSFAAVAQAK